MCLDCPCWQYTSTDPGSRIDWHRHDNILWRPSVLYLDQLGYNYYAIVLKLEILKSGNRSDYLLFWFKLFQMCAECHLAYCGHSYLILSTHFSDLCQRHLQILGHKLVSLAPTNCSDLMQIVPLIRRFVVFEL